ncbi:MAG: hypothetical protein JXA20_03590 [Spirochaetes bacterium]|nr:hypothetical protein [Spirochaetota bacterium]
MRKGPAYLACIILSAIAAGCGGMLDDWQGISSGERQVIWQSVDGPAGTLNVSTSNSAGYPRLLSADGMLFAAWNELGKPRLKMYGGDDSNPQWITLPAPSCSTANSIAMAYFQGRLYLLIATGASPWTYVMRLRDDLSGWDMVSPPDISFFNNPAEKPNLVIYNGSLYALWCEASTAHIKRYDGATTWTDSVEDSHGIDDVASSAEYLSATVYNGHLVAAYKQLSVSIKVRAYNGATWTTWAEEIRRGTTANDLAYDTSLHATNGRLYLAWQERNVSVNYDSIWVKDITPGMSLWTDFDTSNLYGLRYHRNNFVNVAFPPYLGSVNGRLYAAWRETPIPGGLESVRLALFSGEILSPSWIFIDGAGTNGLMSNAVYTVQEMDTVTHDSKIYVIFNQLDGTANQAHVMVGY